MSVNRPTLRPTLAAAFALATLGAPTPAPASWSCPPPPA